MKNFKCFLWIIAIIVIIGFTFATCTDDGNLSDIDASLVSSNARYDVITAPQPENIPNIMQSATDGTYNYYLLDIGYVKNTPVYSGLIAYYDGRSPLEIIFEKTSITVEKMEEVVIKTISESTQETHMNELGGKFGVDIGPLKKILNFSAEVNYTRTWGTVTDKSSSTTSIYTTANTRAESLKQSITYFVGGHGEAAGYYRITLFATCDVYFLLKTNKDNSQIIECVATMCARPNTYFALDYDAEDVDGFGKTSTSQEFTFTDNYYTKLPQPLDVGNIVDFAGGKGTADNPYLISTQTHLDNVRILSNQNDTHFKLIDNIGLTGNFDPIPVLNGVFDGNNYEIRNMNIVSPAEAIGNNILLGLFKINYGTIKNVKFNNPQINVGVNHSGNGWIYAGTVCGQNNGLISDVIAANVQITICRDKSAIGGIAGTSAVSMAVIKNCQVSLSDRFGENGDTGGIIGQLLVNSKVENCKVIGGTITHYSIGASRSIGGIAGICDSSKILSCSIGSTFFKITNKQQKPAIGVLCGSLRNGSEINSCGIISNGLTSWNGYKESYYKNEAGSGNEDRMFKVCDGAAGEQSGINLIK
ncbi:MAG: hypothetical protein FWB86_08930 [Treponema sp.]|nr:hypothetical protein [Treponema sp.]MCL2251588.1 hypothetical protein [Treponema sp.]